MYESRHSCLVSGSVLVSCIEFARAVRYSVRVHSLPSFYFLLFCLVLRGTALSCFSLAVCFHVCHVLCEHAACESPY